jgi:release factor glutamine methyltransferase
MQNLRGDGGNACWTILDLLTWTTSYFQSKDIDNPRSTAEILLAHALKLSRIDLYLRYDQPVNTDERQRFKALIQRRATREPVAYIVGEKEFWSMVFSVNADVLVPRPETECLVERALAMLPKKGRRRVLDLGTGSGAILLALAKERPDCMCFGSDQSQAALAVARRNARSHHLAHRVHFFAGSWLEPLQPQGLSLDMIVSNPPYIPSEQIASLQPEVACFEPRSALDGGPDGLAQLGRIVALAPDYLAAGAALILEIGHDQGPGITQRAEQTNAYRDVSIARDYGGLDRVVTLLRR